MTMLRNLSVLVITIGLGAETIPATAQPLEGRTLPALRLAYSGEVAAQRGYEAYAARAEEEGWLGVRDLYLALATAEARHAERHARMLDACGVTPVADAPAALVGSTRENLSRSFSAERDERRVRYAKLANAVRPDLAYDVLASLRWCAAAEATHALALAEAFDSLESFVAPHEWFVCPDCGSVRDSHDGVRCACGTAADQLLAIGGAPQEHEEPVARMPLVAWTPEAMAKAFALVP